MGRDGRADGHGSRARHSRPGSVTAGAALTTGMGLMQCLAAAPGGIALLVQHSPTPRELASQHQDVFGHPMTWLFEHITAWLAIQGLLGLLAVVSGVAMWLGRTWARRASQTVMFVLVVSWFGAGIITAMSLLTPAEGGPVAAGALALFRLAAIGVGAVWAGIFALPIWLLERQDARLWFEAPGRPTRG